MPCQASLPVLMLHNTRRCSGWGMWVIQELRGSLRAGLWKTSRHFTSRSSLSNCTASQAEVCGLTSLRIWSFELALQKVSHAVVGRLSVDDPLVCILKTWQLQSLIQVYLPIQSLNASPGNSRNISSLYCEAFPDLRRKTVLSSLSVWFPVSCQYELVVLVEGPVAMRSSRSCNLRTD